MATKAQRKPTKADRYWARQEAAANRAIKKNGLVEIWKDDSDALAGLIDSICTYANRRIWWDITDRWLKAHGERLIPYDQPNQKYLDALQRVVLYQESLRAANKPMTITSRELAGIKKELEQKANQGESE